MEPPTESASASVGTPAAWRDKMMPELAPLGHCRRVLRLALLLGLSLALLFAIAVPRFSGGCRINANESAAIATLCNLRSAQEQIRARAAIDRDGDGEGEYGYFAELAGVAELPGRGPDERLSPAVLSHSFAKVSSRRVTRSGYHYRIYLPGPGGTWLPEAHGGGRRNRAGLVDADAAERAWLAYAWPESRDGVLGGRRAFLCDQRGEVHAMSMRSFIYRGDMEPQPGVTGFRHDGTSWMLASNTTDALGDVWVLVQ